MKPEHCAIARVDVDLTGQMIVYVSIISQQDLYICSGRENQPMISLPEKKKKSFMKSTKAQVHKHRSEVHFISTSLKGNKLRSARTPKTRNSLVVEKPRQRMYSWESQVTLPQHILGVPPHPLPQPPAGAHAFNSGCS